ncbi:MAG TPA: hypothetical protein VK881_14860 [bacterium]|nr:hypothetical protein [bacterium]
MTAAPNIERGIVGAPRNRAGSLTTSVAAGALLIFGVLALPVHANPGAALEPNDALTLVRQALAALEVTPPAVLVATSKVLKALFAQDTRGVDMARVQEAVQALGLNDPDAAATQLIAALRPAPGGPGGVDMTLLVPAQPRFAGTPATYVLLMGAVLLLVAGGLIIRR